MTDATGPFDLADTFLRLGRDLAAEPLKVDETFWPRLMSGALGTFHGEYLVALFAYDSDWPSWERHPAGDEIVLLLSGSVTLVLEIDGREETRTLRTPGSYVLVPRNTWHTARTREPCRMLFITPGEGTEHRRAAAR